MFVSKRDLLRHTSNTLSLSDLIARNRLVWADSLNVILMDWTRFSVSWLAWRSVQLFVNMWDVKFCWGTLQRFYLLWTATMWAVWLGRGFNFLWTVDNVIVKFCWGTLQRFHLFVDSHNVSSCNCLKQTSNDAKKITQMGFHLFVNRNNVNAYNLPKTN